MLPPVLIETFLRQKAVCTDTRNIQHGDIFFALTGPNFNGNAFADKALAAGAVLAVIDQLEFKPPNDERFVVVENVLESLQALARHYRQQFTIPIIGITGSNGKTTTKELMHAVLSTEKKTHATKGNLNNHIGVPLTLLSMPVDTEVAVIEMGANKPGDIGELCKIALPDFGMITNIGHAHLELLGDVDGVERTKGELFASLRSSRGTAWVNLADERVTRQSKDLASTVTYGTQAADYYLSKTNQGGATLEVEISGAKMRQPISIQTQLVGSHNAENVLAATVTGMEMGISPTHIAAAIAAYVPSMNRSQMVEGKRFRILMDAYNANPSSMKVTLENLKSHASGNIGVILGDMFELGTGTETLHRELGRQVAGLNPALFIAVGDAMKFATEECGGVAYKWYPDVESAKPEVLDLLEGIDFVLIKGSRGMALERLMEVLEG